MKLSVPKEVLTLAKAISEAGGKAILVGGSVRDFLLSESTCKDFDIEVYYLQLDQLESILSRFGKVIAVGKSFGVLKLVAQQAEYDFSLPRSENKIGKGHKGFRITSDANMTFEQAAARRDFTINSIGYDILSEHILDPYRGIQDLQRGVLRHIGPAFIEDPLRVMRAMQFAGRFEFQIASETIQLCQTLTLNELPKERIFEEFKKLLLKSRKPSIGLKSALKLGILKNFPELKSLIGVPQDPEWHPEGDVWIHTLMVVDEAAKLRQGDEKADLSYMLGTLCHDFGKPLTTEFKGGRWRSPAHDAEGLAPTETFLRRMTEEQTLIELVQVYVKEHLKPALLYKDRQRVTSGAIRRLALRVPIPDIVRVATADHFGRTTPDAIARQFPAGDWLLQRAANLKVKQNKPKPLLKGRHLLALGMSPGPKMGELIQQSFELQLDGQFNTLEAATAWAERQLKNNDENNAF